MSFLCEYYSPNYMSLPGERLFATSADTYEECVSSLLSDHAGDPRHMLDGIHKENKFHFLWRTHIEVIKILQTKERFQINTQKLNNLHSYW